MPILLQETSKMYLVSGHVVLTQLVACSKQKIPVAEEVGALP